MLSPLTSTTLKMKQVQVLLKLMKLLILVKLLPLLDTLLKIKL